MIVYEVNIVIDASIRADYLAWLDAHVGEILALPGFTGADVMEALDPCPAADEACFCVQYRLVDDVALDAYLRDHAPRLRADGVSRFGDRMRASRRVLRPVHTTA